MRDSAALIAAHPWCGWSLAYSILLAIPVMMLHLRNIYPPLLRMSPDHPQITLAEVPRWYGPGAWVALIITILCACLSSLKARTPIAGFNAALAVACYCILSSSDLYLKSKALLDSQGHVDYRMVGPCAAANTAVSFCSGVLQTFFVVLIAFCTKTSHYPSHMTIAKVLFIYIASYLPVFTFWLPQRGIRSWVCNEDDDQCKRARIQVDSMVFFGEMLCEVVGLGKDLMFALYPLRLVGNFKDDALMAIPALMSAGVMSIFLWKSSLALKKRIPAAVAVGIVALWVCPVLILFIAPFIFLLLINYPIACAILFLPLLLVATIPSSDAFPNSNISILEMDQTAAIFVAIAFGVMSIRRQFMRVASEKDDNKEAERLPEYIDISKGEVS